MRVAANLAINFEIVQHETVTVLGKPTMKIKDSYDEPETDARVKNEINIALYAADAREGVIQRLGEELSFLQAN
jgi:hypothetical protein